MHHVVLDLVQSVLDALRDFDFALARQQLDRSHLAHVHADRVGRAAKLGIDARQCGLGFLDSVLIGRTAYRSTSSTRHPAPSSYTVMPMSLIMLTMSSICSGSTMSFGR